jgi:putative phosphoesterase
MKKIGLLSDTHSYVDNKILDFFKNCDEIWHAGDIGSLKVADTLSKNKKLIAVHGNIDDHKIRAEYPTHQRFMCEEIDVWITHIGGFPNNYKYEVYREINNNPPDLFICGHSHILRVMNDKKLNLLHINPGAFGKQGFHDIRTAVRFVIDGKEIKDLEVWETPRTL